MKNFARLSRTEMKNILGGYVQQGQAYCSYSGNCSSWGPTGPYDPEESQPTGTIVANEFQRKADSWCWNHPCCTNADCPGATA